MTYRCQCSLRVEAVNAVIAVTVVDHGRPHHWSVHVRGLHVLHVVDRGRLNMGHMVGVDDVTLSESHVDHHQQCYQE